MNHRQRFHAVMSFKPVDRLPMIEWAGWWDKTIERWRGEGLADGLADAGEIREYLGLDCYRQLWVPTKGPGCPQPAFHGAGIVRNMDEYFEIREHLYPLDRIDVDWLKSWAQPHASGEMVVWFTLEGFFWFPRLLLGIEPHLYRFTISRR